MTKRQGERKVSSPSNERLSKLPATVMFRRQAFGSAVRDRRKELGLSQDKLAERAGIDRQSINRFENSKFSPSLDTVWKVAEALEMPLNDLMAAAIADMKPTDE